MMRAAALLALALLASAPQNAAGRRPAHPRAPGTTELPPSACRPAPAPPAPIDRQRGVALGLFAEDVSFSYGPLLAEIVALGATHVALVVPLYQTDATTHDLGLHTRFSPTLAALAEAARAAKRDGLRGDDLPDRPPVVAAARASGAARWRRAIATPGSGATAICWASWRRSRRVTGATPPGRRQRAVVAGRRPRRAGGR